MLPIKGRCYITQGYGLTDYARSQAGKIAYKNFPGGIHSGIDFGTGGVNAPIISVCDGRVVRAGYDGGWGIHIEIEGADGWQRQYAHCSAVFVKVGSLVSVGDEIGRVGTTGNSTGVHLHFGNRRRKPLGSWEYRDPSGDLADAAVEEPVPITKKLIKGTLKPDVYIFTGRFKYPVPDWPTKVFLFGDGAGDIEIVSQDRVDKIAIGPVLPSLI
jgi:murein DD-endopeptidase MepM/ murein hydrolase activator NlpD